jgi:type II secretory pathway pseudopilin PulG
MQPLISDQKPTNASFKKAFSLIEAAIVLGIIGLVIGGIWIAAASVQENNRVSRHLQLQVAIYLSARLFLSRPASA